MQERGCSSLVHYPRASWSFDMNRDQVLGENLLNDIESHSQLEKDIHKFVESLRSIDMVRLVNVRIEGSSPSLCVMREGERRKAEEDGWIMYDLKTSHRIQDVSWGLVWKNQQLYRGYLWSEKSECVIGEIQRSNELSEGDECTFRKCQACRKWMVVVVGGGN